MRTIWTKTFYLQMLTPPGDARPAAPAGIEVRPVPSPTVDEYLQWYRTVGQDYYWVDRLRMPTDALQSILRDPHTEVYVLQDRERVMGFAELDCADTGEIELVYFGLFPAYTGRGLGKFFLQWIIHRAWSYQPRRVWVHTCDLDHPAALRNYEQAGFQRYDEKMIHQILDA